MHNKKNNIATLVFPPSYTIDELPRVALASILRIHQINPVIASDLAVSLQQKVKEVIINDSTVEIDYQVTEKEILIEIRCANKTTSLKTKLF
mgnify:CR=1 FL=1|tara:strand:+ start:1047 stop:1322 length:276 start_codon:yes stop_codon:yes gene_type:complete